MWILLMEEREMLWNFIYETIKNWQKSGSPNRKNRMRIYAAG